MAYLALGGFVLLVAGLVWLSSRQHQRRATGCCAPADPRDDLRMRSAYDNEIGRGSGRETP